jgi:NADH dehydrogenase
VWRDFRHIDPTTAHVLLLEAGPRILPAFAEALSRHAEDDLRALGVEVRTSAAVTNIDADGVEIGGKERVAAKSVFWAAGVQASGLATSLGFELDRAGRVKVNGDRRSRRRIAFMIATWPIWRSRAGASCPPGPPRPSGNCGRPLASVEGRPRRPALPRWGMATTGKHQAIPQTGRLRLAGFFAWVAWLFIHVLYLIGFKNRISVFAQWVWSYVFSKRGARLITSREWRLPP